MSARTRASILAIYNMFQYLIGAGWLVVTLEERAAALVQPSVERPTAAAARSSDGRLAGWAPPPARDGEDSRRRQVWPWTDGRTKRWMCWCWCWCWCAGVGAGVLSVVMAVVVVVVVVVVVAACHLEC